MFTFLMTDFQSFISFFQSDFLVLEDDSGRLSLGGDLIKNLAPSSVTGLIEIKNNNRNKKIKNKSKKREKKEKKRKKNQSNGIKTIPPFCATIRNDTFKRQCTHASTVLRFGGRK